MTAFVLQYFLEGWAEWKTQPLEAGVLSIGRMPENGLHIQDARLSRFHAQLQIDRGQVWIIDLGASNGVLLGEQPVTPHQWTALPLGSQATLGPLVLRVVPAVGAPAPAPVRAQPPAQVNAAPAPVRTQPPAPTAPPVHSAPQRAQPPIQANAAQAARPAAANAPAPAKPAAARPKWLLPAGLGVVLVCLCLAVVGGGAALFYPQVIERLTGQPAAQTGEQSGEQPGGWVNPFAGATATPAAADFAAAPPVVQSAQRLTAAQGSYSDPGGANLVIPAEALPGEEELTLETARLGSTLQTELEQNYTIDSPAYSLAAAELDGAGRATLSLPAPSAESRLAVLVDDLYLALLPGRPENGRLSAELFIGAPAAEKGYPTMAQANQPNRYFVVTPKEGAALPPGESAHLARQAYEPDVYNCTPLIWHGNKCWTNAAGSVLVLFWNTEMPDELSGDDPLRPAEVIAGVIRTVEQVMSTYAGAGFNNAAISSSNPAYIIISAKGGEPQYSQKTGNIYLGWGIINELSAGNNRCTIAHELFHWVQDESYTMTAAAAFGAESWFLEMGAENGSFLVDAECLGRVLSTYGIAEVGNLLAWQAPPIQWDWNEGSRYINSLQMYISICDGFACVMPQSEFARLTNNGQYPSTHMYNLYLLNAKDMGRYLLGHAPLEARGDAVIPAALRSGMGYGDYIWLKNAPGPSIDFSFNEGRIKTSAPMEATVSTTIAQGGVYPLWVSNGKGSPVGGGEGKLALPALLTVSAGTPLWYSLDNGAPVFHDGGKELEIGSLSAKLGVGLVRLVGVAPDAQKTFSAVVKPVDLSGDWGHILSNTTVTYENCPDSEEPLQAFDFVGLLSGYGTYVPAPGVTDGSRYIWEGEIPELAGTVESSIEVTPEQITVNYLMDMPRPTDSSWLPWALPNAGYGVRGWQAAPAAPVGLILALVGLLVLAAALPGALRRWAPQVSRPGWGRGLALAVSALVLGVWLSGCFGLAMWGTFSGTYTFTRLEHAQPENLPADAAELSDVEWVVTGTGEINYDLHILVVTEDADGNQEEEESVCQASFTTDLQGVIGPADMLKADEE